jgi:hypothetical protein
MDEYTCVIPANALPTYTGFNKKRIQIKMIDRDLTHVLKSLISTTSHSTYEANDYYKNIYESMMETFYERYKLLLQSNNSNTIQPIDYDSMDNISSYLMNTKCSSFYIDTAHSFYKSMDVPLNKLLSDYELITDEPSSLFKNIFHGYLHNTCKRITNIDPLKPNRVSSALFEFFDYAQWTYHNIRDLNISITFNLQTHLGRQSNRIDHFTITYRMIGCITRPINQFNSVFGKLFYDDVFQLFVKYNTNLFTLLTGKHGIGYYYVELTYVPTIEYKTSIDAMINLHFKEQTIYELVKKYMITHRDYYDASNSTHVILDTMIHIPKQIIKYTQSYTRRKSIPYVYIQNITSKCIDVDMEVIEALPRVIKLDNIIRVKNTHIPIEIIDESIKIYKHPQLTKLHDYSILTNKHTYSKTKALLKFNKCCKKYQITPIIRFDLNVQYITPNLDVVQCNVLIPSIPDNVNNNSIKSNGGYTKFKILYDFNIPPNNRLFINRLLNNCYDTNDNFNGLMKNYSTIRVLKDIHYDRNRLERSKHFTAVLYNHFNSKIPTTQPYHFYISDYKISNITCINSVI